MVTRARFIIVILTCSISATVSYDDDPECEPACAMPMCIAPPLTKCRPHPQNKCPKCFSRPYYPPAGNTKWPDYCAVPHCPPGCELGHCASRCPICETDVETKEAVAAMKVKVIPNPNGWVVIVWSGKRLDRPSYFMVTLKRVDPGMDKRAKRKLLFPQSPQESYMQVFENLTNNVTYDVYVTAVFTGYSRRDNTVRIDSQHVTYLHQILDALPVEPVLDYMHTLACAGEAAVLSCPNESLQVEIMSASYGRSREDVCIVTLQQEKVKMADLQNSCNVSIKTSADQLCHRKQACMIVAGEGHLRVQEGHVKVEPLCKDVEKYLYVRYRCTVKPPEVEGMCDMKADQLTETNYIQLSPDGNWIISSCGPGRKWSQKDCTCVKMQEAPRFGRLEFENNSRANDLAFHHCLVTLIVSVMASGVY